MIECSNCLAANMDTARFCSECGLALRSVAEKEPAPDARASVSIGAGRIDFSAPSIAVQDALEKDRRGRSVDILFVLDCTGSMHGEIEAIRDTIYEFVECIEKDSVRARVGLIAFRDRLHGEEHEVLRFGDDVFTRDAAQFRAQVSRLHAMGGGDIPESSLDALLLALRQPFSETSSKAIVLITDAPPHEPDKEAHSVEEVAQAIRDADIHQLYLVTRTTEAFSARYLKLLERRSGQAIELGHGDDFRARAESFKMTLKVLGKTISAGTR